jgi:hypothetical protein
MTYICAGNVPIICRISTLLFYLRSDFDAVKQSVTVLFALWIIVSCSGNFLVGPRISWVI